MDQYIIISLKMENLVGLEESDEDIPRTSTVSSKSTAQFVQPVKIYNKMEVSIDRARARYMNPPLRYGILKTMVF